MLRTAQALLPPPYRPVPTGSADHSLRPEAQ